jgi:hypothetical protein
VAAAQGEPHSIQYRHGPERALDNLLVYQTLHHSAERWKHVVFVRFVQVFIFSERFEVRHRRRNHGM